MSLLAAVPSARLAAAEGEISAGPLGLLVIVLLVIATVLLIRNMNARLKRMPRSFEDPPTDTDTEPQPPSER